MHEEKHVKSKEDLQGLVTNQVFNYTCVNCGKYVKRKFRRVRMETFKRMLCLECNMSYLAKIDPGKFQKSLESNRANHGGKLFSQIDLTWSKESIKWNKSAEGRKEISDRIKNNPNLLESKHLCYNGIYFDSVPEFCIYVYCLMMGIPIIRNKREIGFEYSDSLGYKHYVYPDFIINGRCVEIKGKHFYNSDGTWTQPFRKKNSTDEEYKFECDKYERKRQCLIKNGVTIFKDTDDFVQMCIRSVLLIGINPKYFIVKKENICYGYSPFQFYNNYYTRWM